MKKPSHQLSFEPFLENRKAFLLLRWVIIILSSSLVVFTNLDNGDLAGILGLVVVFSLSNVVTGLLPLKFFVRARSSHWVTIADGVFLSACLFVLRVDQAPIHLVLAGIFIFTLIAKDLKLVFLSVVAVSLLFGAIVMFDTFGPDPGIPIQRFMALALLFLASTFYVFLTASFDRDTSSSTSVLEETRNSEILVEMTRTLSASMNPEEVYRILVDRLDEVMDGVQCSIVRVEDEQAVFLAASDTDQVPPPVSLSSAPVLVRAVEDKRTALVRLDTDREETGQGRYAMAVPMVARGTLIGLIYFPGNGFDMEPSSTTIHFLEVVASTASNSLRNVQMLEEMKHLARTDFLTGLPNHRYFQSALAREVGRAHRHHHDLSLLLIDLDLLKSVNDRLGHQAGDRVIREVARTIQDACREIDFAARYGGEEFVVILPETDLSGAVLVAERIRGRIEDTVIDQAGKITASIGVANLPVNANTRDGLIRIADQALYVAKDGGRNQVAHFKYQMATS